MQKGRVFLLILAAALLSSSLPAAVRTMDVVHLRRRTQRGVATESYGRVIHENELSIRFRRYDGTLHEYDRETIQRIDRSVDVEIPDWAANVFDHTKSAGLFEEEPPDDWIGLKNVAPGGGVGYYGGVTQTTTASISVQNIRRNLQGGVDFALQVEWQGASRFASHISCPLYLVVEFPAQQISVDRVSYGAAVAEVARSFTQAFGQAVPRLAEMAATLSPHRREDVFEVMRPAMEALSDPRAEIVLAPNHNLLLTIPPAQVGEFIGRAPFSTVLGPLALGSLTQDKAAHRILQDFYGGAAAPIDPIDMDALFNGYLLEDDQFGTPENFKNLGMVVDEAGKETILGFFASKALVVRILPWGDGAPKEFRLEGVGRCLSGSAKGSAYLVHPQRPISAHSFFWDYIKRSGMTVSEAVIEVFQPVSNSVEIKI